MIRYAIQTGANIAVKDFAAFAAVRKEDMILRWGGDEFVLLFGRQHGKEIVLRVAQKILDTILDTITARFV